MSKINSFEELIVWQRAHELVLNMYKINFPPEEKYRIQDQLLRASVSIPNNIAEGFGRKTTKDYMHFLHISRGSLYEVKYLLRLIKDLGFSPEITNYDYSNEIDQIAKMLNALISSLNKRL